MHADCRGDQITGALAYRWSRATDRAKSGSAGGRRFWPYLLRNVAASFIDLWVVVAFNSVTGAIVLLIAISDAERPSALTAGLCLLAPPAATALLIVLDGLMNAFTPPGRDSGDAKAADTLGLRRP